MADYVVPQVEPGQDLDEAVEAFRETSLRSRFWADEPG
jgi:hypothetical protein